jgi:hypothetical protein
VQVVHRGAEIDVELFEQIMALLASMSSAKHVVLMLQFDGMV